MTTRDRLSRIGSALAGRSALGTTTLLWLAVMSAACGDPTALDGESAGDLSDELADQVGFAGDCPPGTPDCACSAEGDCDPGALCFDGVCLPCDDGEAGCRCFGNESCFAGLYCDDALFPPRCVDEACLDEVGQSGCACNESNDCAEGLGCDRGVCRPCAADLPGCDCDPDGACEGCLVCGDDDRCRRPFVCDGASRDALDCHGSGQFCVERSECADAECLDASAPTTDAPDASPDATTDPTPDPVTCIDLALACARDRRDCVEAAGGDDAYCGACNEGWVERSGRCVSTGADDKAPDDEPPPTECPVGWSRDPACIEGAEGFDVESCCRRCDICGDGVEPLDVMTAARVCVCPTAAGEWFDDGGSVGPRPCDADGDGWIRRGAVRLINSDDPSLAQAARCTVRLVSEFVLVNEVGEERPVTLAELGVSAPVALTETERNDGFFSERDEGIVPDVPGLEVPFAAATRAVEADEVNSLTRYCVDTRSDFNGIGGEDVFEDQPVRGEALETWEAPFAQLSYFAELHTAEFEPHAGGDSCAGVSGVPAVYRDGDDTVGPTAVCGRYVIRERPRPTGEPATTDVAISYLDSAGEYWRECARRRDATFNPPVDPGQPLPSQVGYDFARFACDGFPNGSCPEPGPPALANQCDGSPRTAARGMNHHSQFRCAVVRTPSGRDPAPVLGASLPLDVDDCSDLDGADRDLCRARGALWEGAVGDASGDGDGWVVNDCAAVTASDPARSRGDLGGAEGERPIGWTCEAESATEAMASAAEVRWVASQYLDYGGETGRQYARGCISEAQEWPCLCDGWSNERYHRGVSPASALGDFGRLVCGCGFNASGETCDIGCPPGMTHYGGTFEDLDGSYGCDNGYCATHPPVTGLPAPPGYDQHPLEDGGPRGHWMCGRFTQSTYTESTSAIGGDRGNGPLTLTGRVSTSPAGSDVLCEDPANCSSGLRLGWGAHPSDGE